MLNKKRKLSSEDSADYFTQNISAEEQNQVSTPNTSNATVEDQNNIFSAEEQKKMIFITSYAPDTHPIVLNHAGLASYSTASGKLYYY